MSERSDLTMRPRQLHDLSIPKQAFDHAMISHSQAPGQFFWRGSWDLLFRMKRTLALSNSMYVNFFRILEGFSMAVLLRLRLMYQWDI